MYNPRRNNQRFSNRRPQFRKRFTRGESIDINRFVKKSSGIASESIVIKNTFADFPFCKELQAIIQNRKYLAPTPIQDQTIGHILDGKDLIGLANTGTGKTAAFLLPLIDKVYKNKYEKVLIIAPTRELVYN